MSPLLSRNDEDALLRTAVVNINCLVRAHDASGAVNGFIRRFDGDERSALFDLGRVASRFFFSNADVLERVDEQASGGSESRARQRRDDCAGGDNRSDAGNRQRAQSDEQPDTAAVERAALRIVRRAIGVLSLMPRHEVDRFGVEARMN